MSSYHYRKSHCGDKTILRPSYLHNGISYTGKTTSLYWIGTLLSVLWGAIITQSIFFKIYTKDTSFLSRVNYGVSFLIWNYGLCSTLANAVLCAISHCIWPVWITNYIHYRLWGEITYPNFPNFSGVAIEVRVWIGNFISHFPGRMITQPGIGFYPFY